MNETQILFSSTEDLLEELASNLEVAYFKAFEFKEHQRKALLVSYEISKELIKRNKGK